MVEKYGLTSRSEFDQSAFPKARDIVVSGWDVRGPLGRHLEEGQIAKGISTACDVHLGDEAVRDCPDISAEAVVSALSRQVERFQEVYSLSKTVVIYVGMPTPSDAHFDYNLRALLRLAADRVPAATLYALASIRAGAHFIDFTPSATLEYEALVTSAEMAKACLAGRDGATGQTYLKLALAEVLAWRGFSVKSWYSANILGNRDGAVLELPEAGALKKLDKTSGLNTGYGTSSENHLVDIRYLRALGDYKEAWDSVLLNSFLGEQVELRINWKAADSPLAACMMLDLARLMFAPDGTHRVGLRTDLGFFFKHPLGQATANPVHLFQVLVESNGHLLVSDPLSASPSDGGVDVKDATSVEGD